MPLACSKEYGTRGTYLVAWRAGSGLGPSAGADGAGLDQVTGAEECADIFLTSWTGDSRIIIQPPRMISVEGIVELSFSIAADRGGDSSDGAPLVDDLTILRA